MLRCIVYIDLNMVRAGVVDRPSDWHFGGYNEIQEPKRKKIIIDYDRLRHLLGFETYERMKDSHKRWVENALDDRKAERGKKWTRSIAVGSEGFIEKVKSLMGMKVIGRRQTKSGDSFQLREDRFSYGGDFGAEKVEIEAPNTYLWNL